MTGGPRQSNLETTTISTSFERVFMIRNYDKFRRYLQTCILNIVIKNCNHFMYTAFNLTSREYASAAQLQLMEHSVSNHSQ